MNTIYKSITLLFLIFLGLSNAFAVTVAGLYTATVKVDSRSASDRQQATQDALKQVFIKVSGNDSVTSLAPIQASLANANNYLQQFGYIQKQEAQGAKATVLQAAFNKRAINDVLTKAGQAIWGNNRPLVLVWLAVDNQLNAELNQEQPTLIGNDPSIDMRNMLLEDASKRGLPMMLPILDLQDMQTISSEDVWNQNIQNIEQASHRYGADAIVIARATKNANNQWQSQWTLLNKGNQLNWEVHGSSISQVLANGVNDVATAIASRYAVKTGNSQTQQQVELIVTHVGNLDAYAKVKQYLSQLSLVSRLEVVKVEPNQVIFDVQLKGDQYALMQAIALDHILKPMPKDYANINTDLDADSIQTAALYYQFS